MLVSTMSDDQLARVRNKEIGFVFRTFNLLPRASLQNVELPSCTPGCRPKSAETRDGSPQSVCSSVSACTIGPTNSRVVSVSVWPLRGLVNRPSILLADEPTGNLDSQTSEEIMRVFEELSRQGQTVVMVTHEPDIASHARRVVVLRDGVIASDERRDQFVDRVGVSVAH